MDLWSKRIAEVLASYFTTAHCDVICDLLLSNKLQTFHQMVNLYPTADMISWLQIAFKFGSRSGSFRHFITGSIYVRA